MAGPNESLSQAQKEFEAAIENASIFYTNIISLNFLVKSEISEHLLYLLYN